MRLPSSRPARNVDTRSFLPWTMLCEIDAETKKMDNYDAGKYKDRKQAHRKAGKEEDDARTGEKDEDETKSRDTTVSYDLLRAFDGVGDSELDPAFHDSVLLCHKRIDVTKD